MKLKSIKLTRPQVKLRLEELFFRLSGKHIVRMSIEDIFNDLEICVQDTRHNLESTIRERDHLLGRPGKRK